MKYNSVFYNDERYYDPTAGAALLSIIREEKKKRYAAPVKRESSRINAFAVEFCENYRSTHAPRANGKPLKYTIPSRIIKYIKLYEFCMENCEKEWFSVGAAVDRFNLGSARRVEQCFSGRGDIGKIIRCWNEYKKRRESMTGERLKLIKSTGKCFRAAAGKDKGEWITVCQGCGNVIHSTDPDDGIEFSVSKTKSVYFFHTDCMTRAMNGPIRWLKE